ncbi:uncharacterized protein LOC118432492 [Branchiostoma floridae]|uniref:Uncharacterized protein LOC118432492 n=2 Tax=Branchiostoma TaxID=7737 RepID=A0A9J7MI05_BRAFL|nr:uncharacterized protein LOC118432492 [Branchiostoma floridae]CAH1242922.1 Hypp7006 [Branchiostoma lanceolatum]
MAAPSIYNGAFGAFKYNYSRHGASGAPDKTVWVTRAYDPNDLRSKSVPSMPVPRHKPLQLDRLPGAPPYWVQPSEVSLRKVTRATEETAPYVSTTSTRCEEWSTLRQMLPSRGRPLRNGPPDWGTAMADPPNMTSSQQRRFPIINSSMTRFADDMFLTNRLFKLH